MQAAARLCASSAFTASGIDPVDVECANEIGLPIIITPLANVQSVAELAIAHMLAIAKRVRECDRAVREDRFDYRYCRDFCELSGKTLLIVGFGKIGRRTAEIGRLAFGMRVLVYSPSVPMRGRSRGRFRAARLARRRARAGRHTSPCISGSPRRRVGCSTGACCSKMKRGAMLVNTARGALVDADALIEAVEGKHLMGAAMDVFEKEPLPSGHPYGGPQDILLSPHIAGSTEEALERTAVETASQVVDVLEGRKPDIPGQSGRVEPAALNELCEDA